LEGHAFERDIAAFPGLLGLRLEGIAEMRDGEDLAQIWRLLLSLTSTANEEQKPD
jgi:hypothetical protein